ncbi:MAG TPA: hypothetical protein VG992_00930 [Candidatus Saccharimonadales bacterium]|nr:hypothetical protein [Candidatus Saccharimonadales bacterium]
MAKMSKSTPVSTHLDRQLLVKFQQLAPWLVSFVVVVLAVLVWGQQNLWHVWPINTYRFFPVLGLMAFSVMWSQYATGWLGRQFNWPSTELSRYFSVTGWVVLVLICLHPGLLIYQRFRDGAGLPPHSYESYVRPGLGWLTLLGSTCLLIFLAYELRRVYADRPWWRYITYLVDAAMLGIFYHGLELGDQLQRGWYRYVWWFYGLTLVYFLAINYYHKYQQRTVK